MAKAPDPKPKRPRGLPIKQWLKMTRLAQIVMANAYQERNPRG